MHDGTFRCRPGIRTRTWRIAVLLSTALLVTGCANSSQDAAFPEGSFAIVANADIGLGVSRVLVGVAQEDGTRLGSPEIEISLTAAPLDDPAATQTVPATFTWMVEDVIGLYRAEFQFDRPGVWEVTVQPATGPTPAPAEMNVLEETFSPGIGEQAPSIATPTLDDFTLAELTTDPEPHPRFYDVSLDDALVSGKPTVLVFSTPAYCQTAACGPLLDIVKSSAGQYPDVNFIHVEVYTGLTDPDFVPDLAHLAPAAQTGYWNLITEPWVFVMDSAGRVTGRFEGVMAAEELRDALES